MYKIKSIISHVLILALLFTGSAFAKENTAAFTDVPESHWAYKAIHDLQSLKITDGIGNNRFGLGLIITRSEFAAFLVKLMKWEPVTPEKGSFTDNIDPARWYYAPIETALYHGVISNDTDKFRVDEPITREEMAVMLVRALGYNNIAEQLNNLDSPFDDVSDNIGYITISKDFGIIDGVGNNLFKPNDTAKREEAAAMLTRMYQGLKKPINELHAFYAIRSAEQADMIKSLDSVGFGWSRLEYDAAKKQVVINTSRSNNNEYAIPDGFSQPLTMAKENNVHTSLMVLVKNDTLISTENQSGVPLVEYILTNPEVRRQVIDSIMLQINSAMTEDEALSMDGVVIDFENMRGDLLKESFNVFLKELKQELDRNNKFLYVAVHPVMKTGQAYYDGYDYRTIGDIADKVILMAHDYYAKQLTDAEMQRGYTTTPVSPIDEVYYAMKSITSKDTGVQDRSKIWVQFSFDAVQWKLREGKVINKYPYNPSYGAVQQRLLMDDVTINYSARSQNPYATFFDSKDETHNVIWYEDSRSIQAKTDLAKMFGIQGISLWRLGNIPDYEETGSKELYLDVWKQLLQNME